MEIEDRRTFERFNLELAVSYSGENCPERNYVHTRDISASGLGIISDNMLVDGSELDLALRVPTIDKEFPAKGKVIWSKRCGNSFRAGIALDRSELMEVSTILRLMHPAAN